MTTPAGDASELAAELAAFLIMAEGTAKLVEEGTVELVEEGKDWWGHQTLEEIATAIWADRGTKFQK